MRVAVGGMSYETSTFTPAKTDLESFRERAPLRGLDILQRYGCANIPIGGFMDAARTHGFELVCGDLLVRTAERIGFGNRGWLRKRAGRFAIGSPD